MASVEDMYEKIAQEFLRIEKNAKENCCPPQTCVTLSWRRGLYVGGIQEIAPEYSPEIVLLSKSDRQLPGLLIESIKRLGTERLELLADDSLDLNGRFHVLRRLENKLVLMTPEQTEYIAKNPPEIDELNSIENPNVYPRTIRA